MRVCVYIYVHSNVLNCSRFILRFVVTLRRLLASPLPFYYRPFDFNRARSYACTRITCDDRKPLERRNQIIANSGARDPVDRRNIYAGQIAERGKVF